MNQLCKVIPGFAAHPPIPAMDRPAGVHANVAAILRAPSPNPGANVMPPAAFHFPTHTDISLTTYEIGYLCKFYIEDMGIVAGDNVHMMRNKLKAFLSGNEICFSALCSKYACNFCRAPSESLIRFVYSLIRFGFSRIESQKK